MQRQAGGDHCAHRSRDVRLVLLIAAAWLIGSVVLGVALGRVIRRLSRRYPVADDTARYERDSAS